MTETQLANAKKDLTVHRIVRKICAVQGHLFKVRKIGRIFFAWKHFKQFVKKRKQQKLIAHFFRSRRAQIIIFAALRRMHEVKKREKLQREISNTKDNEIQGTIYKLNNEISELQLKVKSLEESLARSTDTKLEIQKKIQQAFVRGFTTLNFETSNLLNLPSGGNYPISMPDLGHEFVSTQNPNHYALLQTMAIDSNVNHGSLQQINPLNKTQNENGITYIDSITKQLAAMGSTDKLSQNNAESVNNYHFAMPKKESKDHLWQPVPKQGTKAQVSVIRPSSSKIVRPSGNEPSGLQKLQIKKF